MDLSDLGLEADQAGIPQCVECRELDEYGATLAFQVLCK